MILKLKKNTETVNVEISEAFLQKGIVVIYPLMDSTDQSYSAITINSNNFTLIKYEDIESKSKSKSKGKSKISFIDKQREFLQYLTKLPLSLTNKIIVLNKQRREEAFLPYIFNCKELETDRGGVYLYVWPALSPDLYAGFKQYVTAGCLFGSSLRASTSESDVSFPLIQLNFKSFEGKLINSIFLEETTSIYENVLFNELEMFSKLIREFSKNENNTIFYHLPYYDYIIFVANLLVSGNITYSAFDAFHKILKSKSEIYFQKIREIFKINNLNVKFESPYKNIFGNLSERINLTTDKILSILDIDLKVNTDSVVPFSQEEQIIREKFFVQHCWDKLINNTLDMDYQKVWENFQQLQDFSLPTKFSELISFANTVLTAVVSSGVGHFETCLVLPRAEKQIQVAYDKLLKNDVKRIYTKVINVTFFDSVVIKSKDKEEGLFYSPYKVEKLSDIINSARKNLFQNYCLKEVKSSDTPVFSKMTIKSDESQSIVRLNSDTKF